MSDGYFGFDPKKFTLVSPIFTGAPTSPTPPQFNDTERLATTEFVQRALGNLAGTTNVSTSTTLLTSNAGMGVAVTMAGAGQTVSLPDASTVPAGSGYLLINLGQPYILARSGANNLSTDGSSKTSFTIPTGGAVLATSNGGSTWLITGPGVLSQQGDMLGSLAASGYQKLPSGLIIQWGTTTAANVTFPIAFPTALLHLQLVINNFNSNGAIAGSYTATTSTSTTGFTVVGGAAGVGALRWIAFGN